MVLCGLSTPRAVCGVMSTSRAVGCGSTKTTEHGAGGASIAAPSMAHFSTRKAAPFGFGGSLGRHALQATHPAEPWFWGPGEEEGK